MDDREVERRARFAVGDTVSLPVFWGEERKPWLIERRYWREGEGIVYDLEAYGEQRTGVREVKLRRF
jgi:hypothetical protein